MHTQNTQAYADKKTYVNKKTWTCKYKHIQTHAYAKKQQRYCLLFFVCAFL